MQDGWGKIANVLAVVTGSEWSWDHTGGGCYALVTRCGDRFIVVTWADDTFTYDSVPDDVADYGGYAIGVYGVDEEDYWGGSPVVYDTTGDAANMVSVVGVLARAELER
jgi:hypothetical protein